MAALAQPIALESLVGDAVRTLPLPKGVRLSSISFDTDHAGDPAVRVFFSVSKKIPLTPLRLRNLTDLDKNVTDVVRGLQTGLLTYVRFLDAV